MSEHPHGPDGDHPAGDGDDGTPGTEHSASATEDGAPVTEDPASATEDGPATTEGGAATTDGGAATTDGGAAITEDGTAAAVEAGAVAAGPTRLRLRRAPRYGAFGLTGAAIGVLAGVVVALSFTAASDYSMQTIAGYFAAILGLVGGVLGLGLAVVIERR